MIIMTILIPAGIIQFFFVHKMVETCCDVKSDLTQAIVHLPAEVTIPGSLARCP